MKIIIEIKEWKDKNKKYQILQLKIIVKIDIFYFL